MGFEPTISTVTGWRALRAALRGRYVSKWLRWESNPQHPWFYAKVVCQLPTEPLSRQYPEQESNLQTLGFKPSRSAGWRIWA